MADESAILNSLKSAGDFFGREMNNAANAGVAMAGELLTANQSLSAYTSALDGNSKILGSFGKVINGLTKFAEESLQEYQTLSGIGATFGKEMANIKISAAEMGMSVKDMTDLIMKNTDGLRAFGGTTDLAISRFSKFSKAVLDNPAGTELRRLGYTASDINETLLVYNELAQQDGLNRTRSTADQVASAKDFAVELDGLAKLTGKQRKELADDMKSRRREGDVQAFLMGQSAETQEQFMMATQKIKDTMGPQFEALFQDLMIRGAPITDETRNAFIALGGSADEFEATVASFKQGMGTGDFDNFNNTLTGAQGAFLENLKTDEARTMAMQSGLSGVADAMSAAYSSSYEFANAIDASAEGQESATATIQKLQTQISEEQLTQMQTTGGLLDKTIQMQESLRQFTIAATTEVLPRLEAMAVKGIDMFLERLPSADQIAAQLGSGVGTLFDKLDERSGNPLNIDLNNTATQGDREIVDATSQAAADMGATVGDAATESEQRDTEISQAVATAQSELQETQANFNQERADAETELQRAQADLLRADAENAAATAERVSEAQAKLDDVISTGNQSILNAMSSLNRAQARQANPGLPTNADGSADWRYARRNFKGGKINPGETALVGESGAEFVRGPGEVTSANDSASIMKDLSNSISAFDASQKSSENMSALQNLLKGVKTLDETVQTQSTNASNSISNTNKDYNNMEKKYDTMIGLLTQLVSVESNAANTAQRTYKATRGLQGNMLKGLGA